MFSLAISHMPWLPERVRSMYRLREQVSAEWPQVANGTSTYYKEFTDRAPNWVWSEQMWSWAADLAGITECVFLQDDVVVAPNFWGALEAMTRHPWQIMAFHCAHPAARGFFREGKRWYTTADGLIGIGYVLRQDTLKAFLQWRTEMLKPRIFERINEDDQINLFAMANNIKIWHPVPTIVDHDLSLDSTYGNDHHMYRRPQVLWTDLDMMGMHVESMEQPEWWGPPIAHPVHLGRFYKQTHQHMRFVLKDDVLGEKLALKYAKDVCPDQYRKFFIEP